MDDKIKDQKQALALMKSEFERESRPSGEVWTEEEIQQLLRSLPVAIYNQGIKVVETMVAYKEAKLKLKQAFNSNLLEANFDPDLKSAAERKSWSENQRNYIEAEENTIISEGNFKGAELHYEAYESLYTAVKKAAALLPSQFVNNIRN